MGLVVIIVLGAGAVLGVPRVTVAAPVVPAVAGYLNTSAVSFAFEPALIDNVSTNVTIHVYLTNADTAGAPHTLTIIGREGWVIPLNYTATQLNTLAYGTKYPNLLNINATTSGIYQGNFTVTSKGWYEFVCTEAGHFQSGMYGFVSFGESLPSNLTISVPSTGPGLAVFIIVGTIVALTVLAIVLGFVVGRRQGAEFEMPPERLGYPEPPEPAGGPLPPSSPPALPPSA